MNRTKVVYERLLTCPVCKGAKKTTSTSTEYQVGAEPKVTQFTMNCFDCNGTGKVTAAKIQAMKAEAALWCKCGKSDNFGPIFHDDGTCRQCYKHHYHCGNCEKISQVG